MRSCGNFHPWQADPAGKGQAIDGSFWPFSSPNAFTCSSCLLFFKQKERKIFFSFSLLSFLVPIYSRIWSQYCYIGSWPLLLILTGDFFGCENDIIFPSTHICPYIQGLTIYSLYINYWVCTHFWVRFLSLEFTCTCGVFSYSLLVQKVPYL